MSLTIPIEPRPCPTCGVIIRQATGIEELPRPGHVTICAECAEVLQFGIGMATHVVTYEPFRLAPKVVALRAEVIGKQLGASL